MFRNYSLFIFHYSFETQVHNFNAPRQGSKSGMGAFGAEQFSIIKNRDAVFFTKLLLSNLPALLQANCKQAPLE